MALGLLLFAGSYIVPYALEWSANIVMLLGGTLFKAVKLFPDKEAVVCGDKRFTYADIGKRVNCLSNILSDAGVRKDSKVAILLPNSHYFLEAYYAAVRLGAIAVPLNYRLSGKDLAFILEDSESSALIADREFSGLVESMWESGCNAIGRVLLCGTGEDPSIGIDCFDYEEGIKSAMRVQDSRVSLEDSDIAQIYYTSGTTGRPKGVVLTHKNVCTHALGAIAELQLTDKDRWIHVAPMFHLADAWATWALTWVGGTHIFVRSFNPETVLNTMAKEKATISNLIPTMLNVLVNYPGAATYDYSCLRMLLSGGSPIAPDLVRKIIETFQCEYVQTYGMTETCPYLTMSILKAHLKELPDEKKMEIRCKTGREFIAVDLKVIKEDGTEVLQNGQDVGEIIAKGDIVTPYYWKLSEETEKSIKDGWLFTGDLAVVDEEGYLTIVDRKKDMIVTGGENVYSTEVENTLYMHPAVLEAIVIGVPDEKWGEAIKAVVVLKSGMSATKDDLINFCKGHLARYKVPKSVDFVEELPKTGSGKIAKKEFRDRYWKEFTIKVH